ncbi:MAG: oligosaccharide flippase family protein [Verrucomicrobiia bacterium]
MNLLVNVVNFGFNMLLGIWFTPYLLHSLGTAAYGLIPLANQITSYMAIVTVLSNSVLGRYLTVALEQDDIEEANSLFNTALFGNIALILLLAGPVAYAIWHIHHLVNVPSGLENQLRLLFLCTVIGFFATTLRGVFNVAAYYTNRLHLQTAIGVLQQVGRVTVVVILFTIFGAEIWQVGLATLISGLLGWGWSIRLWRRLTPMLRVSFVKCSVASLRRLLSTGTWLTVNHIGVIFFLAIDLLIVNRLLGTEAGGQYAATLQWSVLIRNVATVVAAAFAPTITYLYARRELHRLVQYGRQSVKFLGLAIGLPIALISGLSKPLLHAWLGPEFSGLAMLMALQTVHLSINLCVLPLFNIQTATNRVRVPALVTLCMGALNVVLAVWLCAGMRWGLYGVAVAAAIAWTTKNLLFTPLYAAHILGCPYRTFIGELLVTACMTLVTAGVCFLLAQVWELASWRSLAVTGICVMLVYAVASYSLVLTRGDRVLVRGFLAGLRGRISCGWFPGEER